MALKSLIITIIVITAMAFPQTTAQAEEGILGLINIHGLLYCTPDGNPVSGTTVKAFSGAGVKLMCGGGLVSSSVTNAEGKFEMAIDPLNYLLSTLLSSCHLQVTTPLNTCNVMLPAVGGLVSALAFVGNTLIGTLLVFNLIPAGFQYVPSI